MKPKLLNELKVCLLTFVVLSPALVVMSAIWKQHLDFMATQLTNNGENPTVNVLLWLMLFVPSSLCVGISLHDRYVVYRAAVLKRQVEMLERLWQRNTHPEEIIL